MPCTVAPSQSKQPWDTLLSKVIPSLLIPYLELVARTSRITVQGDWDSLGNAVVGFWHTDSCAMNLLLRQMQTVPTDFSVITTKDPRGDCIAKVLTHYGAAVERMPDGLSMRHYLSELKEACRTRISNLCIALDGPLGPLHEPHKLGFYVAHHAEKNVLLVQAQYSRKLSLFRRWDRYAIPLPWAHIQFNIRYLGSIHKEDLRNFDQIREKIRS